MASNRLSPSDKKFIKIAFPHVDERDGYYDTVKQRMFKEPWTWFDFERRQILKRTHPKRYAHLPVDYNLYHEAHNIEPDWQMTGRFKSYREMINYITGSGYVYRGYTSYVNGDWVGYYTRSR